MKSLGIGLVLCIAAGCASTNGSPPTTPEAANRTPEAYPSTPMQRADVTAPATAPAIDTQSAGDHGNEDASLAASSPAPGSASPPLPPAQPTDNQASTPTQPDNSKVNSRDKGGAIPTAMDQGSSESDRTITQQIRKAVMKDSALSFMAKNVKIITIDGKVTLRGPVKTSDERAAIESDAKQVAGVAQVNDLLEVKK